MKLMSYRPVFTGKFNRDLYGKLIAWWAVREFRRDSLPMPEGGPFSHSELLFSTGCSFSSRKDGVSFSSIDYSVHPGRWCSLVIPCTAEEEEAVYRHAVLHVGERYDWVGIVADRVLKTSIHTSDRWWCSEVIAHVLNTFLGSHALPEMVTPTGLSYVLGG